MGKILPLPGLELRPLDRPARSHSLYRLCDALAAPGTHLSLFAGDICTYATEKHKRLVLSKLQWGLLKLNGRDIPFVNNVTYLGVIFKRRMTWRHHVERTAAKDLRTHVRTYSLSKFGRLSTNIKFTLYKALIRSFMAYACPFWEYATDARLLKLQRLQNSVHHSIGNLDRCTTVYWLHVAFRIPYVYDYITKLCRTQAEIILNHVKSNCTWYWTRRSQVVRPTTVQLTNCSSGVVT
jgi:hypothetical protein